MRRLTRIASLLLALTLTLFAPSMAAAQNETVRLPVINPEFRDMGAFDVRTDRVEYNGPKVSVFVTIKPRDQSTLIYKGRFTATLSGSTATTFPHRDTRHHDYDGQGTTRDLYRETVQSGQEYKIVFLFEIGTVSPSNISTFAITETSPLPLPGQPRVRMERFSIPSGPVRAANMETARLEREVRPQYFNRLLLNLLNVTYTFPHNRDTVIVRMRFNNQYPNQSILLAKSHITAFLHRRSGSQMSPYDMVLMVEGSDQSRDIIEVLPNQSAIAELYFRVGSQTDQRDVSAVTLYENTQASDGRVTRGDHPYEFRIQGGSGLPAPSSTAGSPANPEILREFEGVYRTNRDTRLTLKVQNGVLVGEAMTLRQPSPRERVRFELQPDGRLVGTLHDEINARRIGTYNVTLRFSPDWSRFAGTGVQQHTDTPQDISYTGVREADAPATGAQAEKPGAGLPPGFVEAGFLAVRLDAVGRATDQGVSRIDVALTALNTQADRRGLQYNDKTFVLVTGDGGEYRWDGNYYGATGADRLVNTVWLEKDEQAQATYVYHVPADRTPNRLSIREGGREIATLDLTKAGEQRAAATDQKTIEGGTAMGQSAILGRFEVTLDKVQRDSEGAWEALVTVKNASSETQRLHIADLTVALYGQDGQARNMNGQFYDYAAGPRRLVESGMSLPAGAQTRFRLYFPESANVVPARYRLQELGGEAAGGPITP